MVSLTDGVGIGSEQAGHDAWIRSAVDCDDELALIGTMMIPSWIPTSPHYPLLFLELLDILRSGADFVLYGRYCR
jgi:hypothetical protein